MVNTVVNVCLHDLLSLAKKVCIVFNHNRLDAGWQLCAVLLPGSLCAWWRFPGSAGVGRAGMGTGRKGQWSQHGNGTVVTGFPAVERWSCGRPLPTVTGCMGCRSVIRSDKSGDGRYHCRKAMPGTCGPDICYLSVSQAATCPEMFGISVQRVLH